MSVKTVFALSIAPDKTRPGKFLVLQSVDGQSFPVTPGLNRKDAIKAAMGVQAALEFVSAISVISYVTEHYGDMAGNEASERLRAKELSRG